MNWELLSELCRTPGGPGREERVRKVVIRELEPITDGVHVDRMGNVIGRRGPRGAAAARKIAGSAMANRTAAGIGGTDKAKSQADKGARAERPRTVMLSAHMDEISLMVTHIEESGFLRFTTLGGFDPKTLSAQRVIVHGRKDVLGLIGSKPIHIMSDEERSKMPKLETFFIDLGLPRAKVEKLVRVGDLATRERDFVEVGDSVSTKSLDDRVGLFVMIEAVRKAKRHGVEVLAVATTQEEIGIRGAQVAAHALKPDLGIALDVTLANDLPGAQDHEAITRLGQGAAIKIMDSSVVCDFRIVDALRDVAQAHRIPHQLEVLAKGGSDTAAIQRAGDPTPVACISIPCRYVHSVIEMCHKRDVQCAIDLLAAFLAEAHRIPLDF